MKKLLCFVLTAALCFTLFGCGKSKDNTPADTDTEPAFFIELAINPLFSIGVNDGGNVTGVECLNDDAKAVALNTNVIGKPCEEAISLLLAETAKQGFLKHGGNIQITVKLTDKSTSQQESINQKVMESVSKFLAQNNINAQTSLSSQMINQSQNDSGNNAQSGPGTIKGPDGSITVVDDNGQMIQVVLVENGSLTVQHLDKEGNIASQEKGITHSPYLAGETINHTDNAGNNTVAAFDAGGNLQHSKQTFADGTILERNYSGGKLTREYTRQPNGTYVDITYTASGARATEKSKQDDGSVWELTYNADGSYYGYTYYADGSVWYNEWNANHVQDLGAQKQIK